MQTLIFALLLSRNARIIGDCNMAGGTAEYSYTADLKWLEGSIGAA